MTDEATLTPLNDFRADPSEHGRDAGSAPAMLRLKLLKPGGKPVPRERWALPYTLLKRVELDNPSKLILAYSDCVVTIQGPRMDELFDQISQHRTSMVEVISQAKRSAQDRSLNSVDSIDVEIKVGDL